MTKKFSNSINQIPLAEILRADKLEDVVWQEHILNKNWIISKQLEIGNIKSMIFWWPPGCWKTTIAKLIANYVNAEFVSCSAVFSGVAELKKIFQIASDLKRIGKQTILFVDEIHRFNKAQQDSFLPYVENWTIVLIWATTENPSFELNSALLSRCQVIIFNRLNENDLEKLIKKAEKSLDKKLPLTQNARKKLIAISDWDGRYILNIIETIFDFYDGKILDENDLDNILQARMQNYDKSGEAHYNLISALHKSVRGSDPDATLYWVCRMLEWWEDKKFLLRRLIRMSFEDIGLADPNALPYAVSVADAYERLWSPEWDLAIAELAIYLATCPKSNKSYVAFGKALDYARKNGSLPPPKHIINAPTSIMKEQGFWAGYVYDPDTIDGFSGQNYFPEWVERQKFYEPIERWFEREIKKRIEYWEALRRKKGGG